MSYDILLYGGCAVAHLILSGFLHGILERYFDKDTALSWALAWPILAPGAVIIAVTYGPFWASRAAVRYLGSRRRRRARARKHDATSNTKTETF